MEKLADQVRQRRQTYGHGRIVRSCLSKIMGNSKAEEMQLSATVLIGDANIRARGHRRLKELQYLGHRITDQGIGTDPEKVSALLKSPANISRPLKRRAQLKESHDRHWSSSNTTSKSRTKRPAEYCGGRTVTAALA
ncbi:uncharacterized protein LOC121467201 [Drosophila elegans]|uniref:uncharacterized protein LOC121467201 n=1 Tax=Drosophila elegans TaxID=30023 RepID=UPI001BC867F1|nr:uncharacterized protein LOC121467201 [Drosophila elegans]